MRLLGRQHVMQERLLCLYKQQLQITQNGFLKNSCILSWQIKSLLQCFGSTEVSSWPHFDTRYPLLYLFSQYMLVKILKLLPSESCLSLPTTGI